MQNGQRIVLAYLTLFLVAPAVSHLLVGPAAWNQYHYFPLDLLGLAVIGVIVAVQFLPSWNLVGKLSLHHRPALLLAVRPLFTRHVWVVNLAFAAILLLAAQTVPTDLRYLSAGITSTGKAAMVMLAAKAIVAVLILRTIVAFVADNHRIALRDHVSTIAMVIAFCTAVGGQSDLLSASLFGAFVVFPKFTARMLYISSDQPNYGVWRLIEILCPVLLALQLYIVLYFGEGIKSGLGLSPVEGALQPDIGFFITRIMDRLSSHYYSLAYFLNGFAYLTLADYLTPLVHVMDSFTYRWHAVIGAEANWRPDIQSLSRFNFTSLSLKESAVEGTSAGVYSSFSYIMPFPLAFVVSVIYLRGVSSLLSSFFSVTNSRLTLAGTIIFLHEVLFFFQSPVDFLLILDNSAITFAFFIFIVMVGRQPASDGTRPASAQPEAQQPAQKQGGPAAVKS